MAPACSGDRGDGKKPPGTAGCGSDDDAEGTNRRAGEGGVSTVGTYVFDCPECGQDIEVDASMRAAILSNGCPVCTEPVATACFEAPEE